MGADDRRSWLTHGLAALAVSGLGLAVAASMAVTTSAETTSAGDATEARVVQTAPQPQVVPSAGAPQQGSGDQPLGQQGSGQQESGQLGSGPLGSKGSQAASSVSSGGALAAFVPRSANDPQTPDDLVRAAVVKERAAQRAEDLSKTAEDASRLARTAGSKARSQKLAATDLDIRETAVKIATERRQRATAIRVAAEVARKVAEAAAARAAAPDTSSTSSTTPSGEFPSTPDTSPIDTGGQGFSPVPGAVIGTPFGATGLWARYHTGLDFRAAEGTPIRAVKSGVVLYAGNSGNWSGNHVAIIHADGITTMSSHMSSMAVHAGEQVEAGQVIGRVGQTGRAFGAHLHFEVYPRGVKYGDIYHAINPVPWLRSIGVITR